MTLIFFISTLIFAYLYSKEKRKNNQYTTATQTVANEANVSADANPAMVVQPQVQIKKSKMEEAQEYWADVQLRRKRKVAFLKDLEIVLFIIAVALVISLFKK